MLSQGKIYKPTPIIETFVKKEFRFIMNIKSYDKKLKKVLKYQIINIL